jgi:hypothetical protein
MTDVTLTIEPNEHGYGQNMLTVERDGAEWERVTGCLILTDGELEQVACLIENHRDGNAMGAGTVTIRFADSTGRCSVKGCQHAPGGHEAVIVRPIAVDPGTRVLFEGTLGACREPGCPCRMYSRPSAALADNTREGQDG